MNRSILIAVGLMAVLIVFFGVGTIRNVANTETDLENEQGVIVGNETPPDAIVSNVVITPHPVQLNISGRTAPDRSVVVKASTTGTVVSTPAIEGTYVKRGAVLCSLDVEARNARVQEAQAMLAAAEVDYNAAKTLASKGLSPENAVTSAQAQVDGATAAVNAARIELSKTQITAPFAGIFETRMAEAGDFLSPGASCGLLVDLSPLILAAEVSETYAGRLQTGLEGQVKLKGGQVFPAKVRYVSQSANEATRTFLIEAEIDTGDVAVPAGVSAEFKIALAPVPATLVSPAQLALADSGELGLRYVTEANEVRFAAVSIIDSDPKGTWVTGVPEGARIITVGQEYLSEGVKVTPILQDGDQP